MTHNLEIRDLKLTIEPLKFKDSLQFAKNSDKLNFFEFVKMFLDKITSLDNRQINDMLFQDAITILVYYRMLFFDNESLTDDGETTPKSFLTQKPDYKEKIIEIGGYRFTNLITLGKIADAEKFCYLNKSFDFMGLFLMMAGCLKSLQTGKNILFDNAIDTQEFREQVKQLDYLIGSVSNTRVSLLFDLENVSIVSDLSQALALKDNFFFWD